MQDAGHGMARSSSCWTNLGVAHDVVAIGGRGASWGFGLASDCILGSAAGIERAAGPNSVSAGLRGVDGLVGVARTVTHAGQDATAALLKASLCATQAGLKAAGARDGDLLRLAVGDEAAESVIAVEALVRAFAGPLAGAPLPHLMAAVRAWGALQEAGTRDACHAEQAALPHHCERWMRYAAATFGAEWLEGFSVSAAARARAASLQGRGPGDVALACAGVEGRVEVIAFQQSTNGLFAPGYMVAVDYEHHCVVVSLRGTTSISDILADLLCGSVALTLGGVEGMAHEGMLRAASRMEALLLRLTEEGLAKLQALRRPQGPLRVLVSGHSLGAGVAALVTALWRDNGRLPGVDVQCIAFACPQILDSRLAAALSNHTTSVIVGDDMVPRLSLATATDLRSAVLHLSSPVDYGLGPSFHAHNILASAAAGEADHLHEAYATVRHAACTSPNRLFPPGRLIHLVPGDEPRAVSPCTFDELRISQDMASAHMPRRYLIAIRGAMPRAA